MPRFFLRVEGVNLGNVLDDTDDLSTRRGGGLMVLNAPRQMVDDNEPGAAGTLDKAVRDRLRVVSTGASIGLFDFDAADETEAKALAEKVRDHLRRGTLEYQDGSVIGHLPLTHATFVVDVAPVGANEQEAEQIAVARNRWRQLQTPTVPLTGLWAAAVGPCHFNMALPATETEDLPENKSVPVSATVKARRKFGRGARQRFYEQEVGPIAKNLSFTNSFQELAARDNREQSVAIASDAQNENKLAVFYVDGNSFGEKGRQIFRTQGATGFKAWSESLQAHHKAILKGLIDTTRRDDSWRYYDFNDRVERIRLETLLWGGDEILFVVPAWKGWELARWFFGQPHEVPGERLSYSCGLVFCHAKAPIKYGIGLAKKLAELAKPDGRKLDAHRLAYEVLESFDDISGDLEDHRKQWLPKAEPPGSLILDPTKPFWAPLQAIADSHEFPVRQLYRLCKAWRTGEDYEPSRTRLTHDTLKEPVTAFLKAWDDHPVAWLHLLQMLPYTPPTKVGAA